MSEYARTNVAEFARIPSPSVAELKSSDFSYIFVLYAAAGFVRRKVSAVRRTSDWYFWRASR